MSSKVSFQMQSQKRLNSTRSGRLWESDLEICDHTLHTRTSPLMNITAKRIKKINGTRCELSDTRAKHRHPVYFIQGWPIIFSLAFINAYEIVNPELGFIMFQTKHFIYDYGVLWNTLGMSRNCIYMRLRTIWHFCEGRYVDLIFWTCLSWRINLHCLQQSCHCLEEIYLQVHRVTSKQNDSAYRKSENLIVSWCDSFHICVAAASKAVWC